jgi:hypothetical protein
MTEIYSPAFDELETLHVDHLDLFLQFKTRLADASVSRNFGAAANTFTDLKSRRSKLLPSRIKLLAFNSIAYGPTAQQINSAERYFLISLIDYYGADRSANRHAGDQIELLETLEKQLPQYQSGNHIALAQADETCSEIISSIQQSLAVCDRLFNKLHITVADALLSS